MTSQKAVEQLEALIEDRRSFLGGDKSDDEIYQKDIWAIRIAITAIDLRTPKKPKKSASTGNYICPNCLAVTKPKNKQLYYCIWCGQALHM